MRCEYKSVWGKCPHPLHRLEPRELLKVSWSATTLTLSSSRQLHGRRCAHLRAPCASRAPVVRTTAAKTPSDEPSSTSTTVADTSAATSSRWVHIDVALRCTSGAARRRGRHRRSLTTCRKPGASAQSLARALEEQRTARPVRTSPPLNQTQSASTVDAFCQSSVTRCCPVSAIARGPIGKLMAEQGKSN